MRNYDHFRRKVIKAYRLLMQANRLLIENLGIIIFSQIHAVEGVISWKKVLNQRQIEREK